jgi:hypothetical protein
VSFTKDSTLIRREIQQARHANRLKGARLKRKLPSLSNHDREVTAARLGSQLIHHASRWFKRHHDAATLGERNGNAPVPAPISRTPA